MITRLTINSILGITGLAMLPVAGCGSATPTAITPTLEIQSPSNNATVNLPAPPQPRLVAVNFQTNWMLKAPGQCNGAEHCGHVDVFVDSSTCNGLGQHYNAQAVFSPAEADFGKCSMPTGQHMISLELHDDADRIVTDPLGEAVTSSVTVIAQ
jgi:hypothetical protein